MRCLSGIGSCSHELSFEPPQLAPNFVHEGLTETVLSVSAAAQTATSPATITLLFSLVNSCSATQLCLGTLGPHSAGPTCCLILCINPDTHKGRGGGYLISHATLSKGERPLLWWRIYCFWLHLVDDMFVPSPWITSLSPQIKIQPLFSHSSNALLHSSCG